MRRNSFIFYITDNGYKLAGRISKILPKAEVARFRTEKVSQAWNVSQHLIFITASGIVVRTIASLIKDKKTDPAVVVIDEKGKYAISLLSGHLGGANELAKKIADFLKGEAVITTASDVNALPAIDLWARDNNLVIENEKLLPRIASELVNKSVLKIYIEQNKEQRAQSKDIILPKEFIQIDKADHADMVITNKLRVLDVIPVRMGIQRKAKNSLDSCLRRNDEDVQRLILRPRDLVIGIGCNSGTSAKEIEDAVKKVLLKNNLSFFSVHSLSTIDKKKNEPGLLAFAEKFNLEINIFKAGELNKVKNVTKSKAAFKATGAYAVAEPSVLLASGNNNLLVPKQKIGNVTVAIAEKKRVKSEELRVKDEKPSNLITHNSKLYIVGTGPGGKEYITPRAQDAIRASDVIVGYGTYLDLIQELIKDKEVVSTGMTQEVDRCKKAIELAMEGKTVAVISGGDPGIYAMAGLVFELLGTQSTEYRAQTKNSKLTSSLHHSITSSLPVEVIPGISALNACAARLGAPLMHDFASISLSDRLTLWEMIEKRLEAAAKADFVIALYNPKSKGRPDHINRAREIIMKYRNPETPVGIVKGAMRENEDVTVTSLEDMLNHDIDMQTTVIIGNSKTYIWNNRMITPRGYEKKFKI